MIYCDTDTFSWVKGGMKLFEKLLARPNPWLKHVIKFCLFIFVQIIVGIA